MKVRIPRAWESLPASQRERLEDYCKSVALEAAQKTTEKDSRIILDIYTKMVCLILHDVFGFGEKRLTLFLGNHKRLFDDQRHKVQNGTQLEFLDKRMAQIFKKEGFPQWFMDGMLGPVEAEEVEK